MTETQAMGFFFTTLNGKYTSATDTTNSGQWPHVYCTTCHNVPSDHPSTMPAQMVFNSKTAKYDSVKNVSALCGNCHGNLHFPNTDHQLYNGWLLSRHGHGGQTDVAAELSANDAGLTPAQVTANEDCIACHAPTSVQMKGGISEAQALATFFSVDMNGKFSASTAAVDTMEWTEVACNACHDPHHPDTLSYFNSSTRSYQLMSNSNQLCGQCHGNLRFPDTDHLSYNVEKGTGGIGVSDIQTMPGTKCVDCHMYKSSVDGTNSKMLSGHSWQVLIKEPDGTTTASCTNCHSNMGADSVMVVINSWKKEFALLDSAARAYVSRADSILAKPNATGLDSAYVAEATVNMTFAEGDESGGFHNHKYSVALLNDAITKAKSVVTGINQSTSNIPLKFELLQNFPNPFNPSTKITFILPTATVITVEVYDILGQRVALLVNSKKFSAGIHTLTFDAEGLPSGIYLYRISTPLFSQVKKMLLLK
ncbi:MAG: ammonia-forming cytochrome c nitrite reductase subunit c552 [Candidatus Kryptoniota bacterium]